jgi:FixJ family two-component response regulator
MKEHADIRNKKEYGSLAGDDPFLTNRETKILQMLTAGYSNAKIAEELCISSLAVEIHLRGLWLRGSLGTDEYLRKCTSYELSRNRQKENDGVVVNGPALIDI